MFELEVNDESGNRLRFELGGGNESFRFNSVVRCKLSAEILLKQFSNEALETIYHHFYQSDAEFFLSSRNRQRFEPSFGQPYHQPFPVSNPSTSGLYNSDHAPSVDARRPCTTKEWLIHGLANADILVTYSHTQKPQTPEELNKGRNMLRAQIRVGLHSVLAAEAVHAKHLTAIPVKPRFSPRAWGLQVWFAHPNDSLNPVVQAYKRFKAQGRFERKGQLASLASSKNTHSPGNSHLLESIGFVPRTITGAMLQQAWETVDSSLNDPALNSNFAQFAREYTAKEANVTPRATTQGGAVELIFTMALTALGGKQAVLAPKEKTRLVENFQKLGERLLAFEKTTKTLDKTRRAAKGKPASFSDLTTDEVVEIKPAERPPASKKPKAQAEPKNTQSDQEDQARALEAASKNGDAFCEECEKRQEAAA